MGRKGSTGSPILARGERSDRDCSAGFRAIPDDTHSRYIEAEVEGVIVGSIYLPNGNPQPGPKFDYKLAWMERLIARAADLFAGERRGGAGRRL